MSKKENLTAEALKTALGAAKTPEDIQKITEQALAQLATNEKELDNSVNEIANLGEQLELQKNAGTANKTIVKIGDQSYYLTGNRFHFKGEKELNAKELSKDKTKLKQMLEKGSGALTPVKK